MTITTQPVGRQLEDLLAAHRRARLEHWRAHYGPGFQGLADAAARRERLGDAIAYVLEACAGTTLEPFSINASVHPFEPDRVNVQLEHRGAVDTLAEYLELPTPGVTESLYGARGVVPPSMDPPTPIEVDVYCGADKLDPHAEAEALRVLNESTPPITREAFEAALREAGVLPGPAAEPVAVVEPPFDAGCSCGWRGSSDEVDEHACSFGDWHPFIATDDDLEACQECPHPREGGAHL